ncbi:hypothetical protein EXE59_18575 [Nocardioides eburneiflavus]|uniref:Uncharacterized protein n=1 Tax=Nocardioides eburneiflavus TaxID=2518372 RepID=A0A4Z1CD54_9ACTN|nr:hypothetical protein [Nocardioides eburneiflavus]TGN65736.1 hypothetical protein EXE59_18575 [Nocardioides eburneiflavus]
MLGANAAHGSAGDGSEHQARTDPDEAQSGEQSADVGGRVVGPGEEDATGCDDGEAEGGNGADREVGTAVSGEVGADDEGRGERKERESGLQGE